ncbi:hypothetical protein ABVF11_02240 [Pediococcus argentinicus]|uniref:hypothetical protein n=1 Tax=Pediococcus argentinicus TaxID=480391 RepID=UPI00338E4D30
MKSYMDYKMYQAIMAENGYEESTATKLFLKRAESFQRQKTALLFAEAKAPGNKIYLADLKKIEELKEQAIHDAIDCAKVEKLQGFKFLDDGGGDVYMNDMMLKYQGDLSLMTDIEKCTFQYFELLDLMQKEIKAGRYR